MGPGEFYNLCNPRMETLNENPKSSIYSSSMGPGDFITYGNPKRSVRSSSMGPGDFQSGTLTGVCVVVPWGRGILQPM